MGRSTLAAGRVRVFGSTIGSSRRVLGSLVALSLTAVAVRAPEALVLRGRAPVDDDGAPPFGFTWAFVVADRGEDSRLIVRERYAYTLGWAGRMVTPVSWVSFLMSERMLRGIRDRAESLRTHG